MFPTENTEEEEGDFGLKADDEAKKKDLPREIGAPPFRSLCVAF